MLLAKGYRVRALVHRDERALAGLDVEIARADLADPASLARAFHGAEVVHHLAGLVTLRTDNWDEARQVNVLGTRNVVDACLRCGVKRLIYYGSVHSRQPAPFDQPLDEGRPLVTDASLPPYDRSKALAELEVRKGIELGLEAVILLPSAILGPYDFRPSYIGEALQLMQRGGLPALTTGGYNWVDARDVSAGAIRAAETAGPGSCYILSGHWLSIREVAVRAAQMSDRHAAAARHPVVAGRLGLPILEKLATLRGAQPLYTSAMLSALHSNRLITSRPGWARPGNSPARSWTL